MYQLSHAYARKDQRGGIWEPTDVATAPIRTLRQTHGEVWLFITYPSLEAPKGLYLPDIENLLNGTPLTTTVTEWLTSVGNKTLPFADTPPSFEIQYVRYTNAWHAGYHIEPITRIGTLDADGSKWDKQDLLIWRDDLDPEYLAHNALFTVNGLFHFAEYGPQGVHLYDANQTLRRANDNQIGVYSFANVGQVNYVPITDAMIFSQRPGAPLHTGVYVTLPESIDMTNKTFMVVIGGYLQVLGKTYTRVGDRTYRIELANLMMVERFYDSWEDLDLANTLGFTTYDFNDTLFGVGEILEDETVRKMLTMSQSFFVSVETDTFFHDLQPVEAAGLPGRYYDYTTTQLPLMGAYGRMLEYHPIEEDGVTVLCTTANRRHNYDFARRPWTQSAGIDAGRYPYRPFEHTHAFYRMMGTQK